MSLISNNWLLITNFTVNTLEFKQTGSIMEKMPHKDVDEMSLVVRKPGFGVSDQVRHKPGYTTLEYVLVLEISDLASKGIVLSM